VIDIHHHCLPGVDDGPRDWETAVALCKMAADDGIETIIATPHVLRGRWKNTSRAALVSLADALRERIADSPRLLLGSEYFFAHDVAEVLAGDEVAEALFKRNPQAIVEGRVLPYDPEPRGIEPQRGLLGRVAKLFKGH
jgi:tyrosine-protein phosphatase YwqE